MSPFTGWISRSAASNSRAGRCPMPGALTSVLSPSAQVATSTPRRVRGRGPRLRHRPSDGAARAQQDQATSARSPIALEKHTVASALASAFRNRVVDQGTTQGADLYLWVAEEC